MEDEIRILVETFERHRRERLRRFVQRLEAEGALRDGVGEDEALATLALATGFPAFDQLTLDATAAEATERLVRIATSILAP